MALHDRYTADTRAALENALQAAERGNQRAMLDADRAASIPNHDLATPCTGVMLTAWMIGQIRGVLDGIRDV